MKSLLLLHGKIRAQVLDKIFGLYEVQEYIPYIVNGESFKEFHLNKHIERLRDIRTDKYLEDL